ncbi:hypothetical protein F5I97DRAFT_1834097 [Phlebopus sp. FC_14]|nr:hypothetical protein F5I97DRAFT_1834097 [Phlebopus sp. FC_14]
MMSSFSLLMYSMIIPRALSLRTFHVSPAELADDTVEGKGMVEAGAADVVVTVVGAAAADADADTDVVVPAGVIDEVATGGIPRSGSSPDMVPQTFSRCSFARIRIFHIE